MAPGFADSDSKSIESIEIDGDELKNISGKLFYGTVGISSASLIAETQHFDIFWPLAVIFSISYTSSAFSNVWEMRGNWKRFMVLFSVITLMIGLLVMTASTYFTGAI